MLSAEHLGNAERHRLGRRTLLGSTVAVVAVSACFFVASVTGAVLTVAVRGNEPTPVPFGAAVLATAAAGVGLRLGSAGRSGPSPEADLPFADHGRPAGQCRAAAAGGDHRFDGYLVVDHACCGGTGPDAGGGVRTSIGPAGPRAGARSAGEHAARRHRSDGRQPVSAAARQTTRRTMLWRMATGDRSRQALTLTAAAAQAVRQFQQLRRAEPPP